MQQNKATKHLIMLFSALLLALGITVTAAAEPVELKVAMWILDGAEVEPTKEILRTYEKLNPGVKVELMHMDYTGYHEKMLTMAAGGVTPDVLVLTRVYLPSFVDAGIVQPIDKYINPVKSDAVELISGTYKGHVYGVPIWGGPALWMYNGTLFDEVGVPRPPAAYKSGKWTWDDVVGYGKKITRDKNGDGKPDVWSLWTSDTWIPDWVAKIHQFGGRVVSADGTKAMVDQPEAVKAITFWNDLSKVHRIAPSWTERTTATLEKGTLALYGRWSSETPGVAKTFASLDLGLTPQPAGPAGSYHIAGGCPVAVSATTKHLDEASKFAVWFALNSDEWKLRGIPASRKTLVKEYRDYVGESLENADAIVQALSGPFGMEPSVGHTDWVTMWNSYLHQVRIDKLSPQAAAEQIAQKINLDLSK